MSEAGVTKSSVLSTLLENHRLFLAFLERRVGTKADAEDILQAAFVKMMESPTRLPNEERVVAWFYRVLRNALSDHYRRRDAEQRAYQMAARGAQALIKSSGIGFRARGHGVSLRHEPSRDTEARVRPYPRRGGAARGEDRGRRRERGHIPGDGSRSAPSGPAGAPKTARAHVRHLGPLRLSPLYVPD